VFGIVHTTTYSRDKSTTPGFFATTLRKYLKSKRLCDITQLGMDRIVDLRFGDNEFGKLGIDWCLVGWGLEIERRISRTEGQDF
jgi:hypothetical protein